MSNTLKNDYMSETQAGVRVEIVEVQETIFGICQFSYKKKKINDMNQDLIMCLFRLFQSI